MGNYADKQGCKRCSERVAMNDWSRKMMHRASIKCQKREQIGAGKGKKNVL